jgi:acetoin utilization deacetylase AcuC-like enzyme
MDVFFDPVFLEHDTGLHPENSERLGLLLDSLDKSRIKKPRNGEEFLSLVHTPEYIERVNLTCKMGGRLDMDTPVSAKTYEAACYAVGAAVDASESGGFALVRPPGHHAFPDHGSGFCIFNNMAIAALRLAQKGRRVFILDIDVHHGNGTQEIVLDKPNIKFLSTHESPLYPGSGLENRGDNCINIPLPAGLGDDGYIKVLENKIKPEIEKFGPDVVGVSVGFDAHELDSGWVVGESLGLSDASYSRVRKILGPYEHFYTLEGGYNPKSIMSGVRALTGL